ncbi:hypothetical protein CO583_04510 [Parasaccharibacter sp. TMW2.1882]|uniref:Uncharacterized protein n=2 Tax=Acetobacteraceae TaxID=433 RepID=A0A7U7G436_9PROT|nr:MULTISPECIES: hypothetical protein [Acetobacteraceae]MCL1563024.1 hypothetical protein [Parasaccharibacter sp. TMW 2.1886]MCQ0041516.1 hypothetical protein [Bombella sp.]MUG78875.1 hypothetical protein [Bombella sp. ESL0380]MUH02147.1 hypothetical protein [Bombella sp. ESL0387]QGT74618.1 hypothetical protein GN304_01765 [Bombella sp. ESL0368]
MVDSVYSLLGYEAEVRQLGKKIGRLSKHELFSQDLTAFPTAHPRVEPRHEAFYREIEASHLFYRQMVSSMEREFHALCECFSSERYYAVDGDFNHLMVKFNGDAANDTLASMRFMNRFILCLKKGAPFGEDDTHVLFANYGRLVVR